MTHFTIAVTSDTICPWCYIGALKLSKAISLYHSRHPSTADTFETVWHPYQLNPAAPKPGINKPEYYIKRFGAEKAATIYGRLEDVGKALGVGFKFGGKTGNTRDSHRLIHLTHQKYGAETQNAVVDQVSKMYFEEERDITDPEMLIEAGTRAGLNESEVREWMESDAGGTEVDRDVKRAQRRGVTGVPNFVLQGKYEIGGAQDAETFVGIFERVKEIEDGKVNGNGNANGNGNGMALKSSGEQCGV